MLWRCWLGGRKGIWPVKKWEEWWRWALVGPDGVAPIRMVSVSASVSLPLHHKVQKFCSGTGLPGWSWKKGHKTVVVVVVWCSWLVFHRAKLSKSSDTFLSCIAVSVHPCITSFPCCTQQISTVCLKRCVTLNQIFELCYHCVSNIILPLFDITITHSFYVAYQLYAHHKNIISILQFGSALRLGSKGRYGSFHLWINVWVAGKTVIPR